MIACTRLRTLFVTLIISVAPVIGCREADPPPSYDRDLGTGDTPLLPVTSPWKDLQLKAGRADWHPFREPGSEEPVAAEAAEEMESSDSAETETEIRNLLAEYNETIDEAVADGLAEFFVPDQRDAIKPALASALAASEKLSQVTEALGRKLPDAGDRITIAAETMATQAGIRLAVESITGVNEHEATGKLVGGTAPGCTFRLLDDVWYIEFDTVPDAAQVTESMGALSQTLDSWLTSLESDENAAETVLGQMTQPVPAAGEAAAPDPTEPADSEADD